MKFAMSVLLIAVASIAILMAGCGKESNPVRPEWDDSEDAQEISDGHDSSFDEQLKSIAGDYLEYALVNKQPQVAPTRCLAPPAEPGLSKSDDETSHGKKLYFLFASNWKEYQTAATEISPVGQTLVKEAWAAEKAVPSKAISFDQFSHKSGRPVLSKLVQDGEEFAVGDQKDLYIMFKTESTPATDQGWVYGVVTADGSNVLAGGRLQNCMSCHEDAGVDRLFGQ